jgi:hypothetical protein
MRPPPGPPVGVNTCTGSALAWLRPSATRFSDALRPTANVTAVAPSSTAVNVIAVRAGRANGAASPIVTGRGSASLPSTRCAA